MPAIGPGVAVAMTLAPTPGWTRAIVKAFSEITNMLKKRVANQAEINLISVLAEAIEDAVSGWEDIIQGHFTTVPLSTLVSQQCF